jgi:hypothetical protein
MNDEMMKLIMKMKDSALSPVRRKVDSFETGGYYGN